MPLTIPTFLKDLLEGDAVLGDARAFADRASVILEKNDTPFFPHYTDHGLDHVERVIATAVRLIPDEARGLLRPADAAVLIAASVLHDLAMHVREDGFVQLVSPDSLFVSVPWFATPQRGHAAEVPWPQLWADFQRKARHLGHSDLDRLLGPGHRGVPDVAHADVLDPAEWKEADRLLIGEFLRQHHPRLAHEIALHGFPGHAAALDELPVSIRDPAGAVARSHGIDLDVMVDYLRAVYGGSVRPKGSLQLYLMGLLRVADYLQLESERAPVVLLRLRTPRSPTSLQEWAKHRAVEDIDWDTADDPHAIHIQVSGDHGLRTHLALEGLFAGLRREMLLTTGVLSQQYRGEYAVLALARRRVVSNMDGEMLREQLPYVPERAAFRSDEDLFRLVVGDLYGNESVVAGRELLQNAVDAVRERRRLELERGPVAAASLRDFGGPEVVVDLVERDVEPGVHDLRIADRGVGMTARTIIDYFLKAGASLGATAAEREGLGREDSIRTLKAGRFGVGAFAAFLFGDEVRVTTRHIDEERGIAFTARLDDDPIELRWAHDVPVGTEIVVPQHVPFAFGDTPEEVYFAAASWLQVVAELFALDDPDVAFRLIDRDGETRRIGQKRMVAAREGGRWRALHAPDFDAVLWRPSSTREPLVHNGLVVGHPGVEPRRGTPLAFSNLHIDDLVRMPEVAVYDARHRLGLALHRYWTASPVLPFEDELLRAIGRDVVAFGLVHGPVPYPLGREGGLGPAWCRDAGWVPIVPELFALAPAGLMLVDWQPLSQRRRSAVVSVDDVRFATAASLPLSGVYVDPPSDDHPDFDGLGIDALEFDVGRYARRLGACPLATVRRTTLDESERIPAPSDWTWHQTDQELVSVRREDGEDPAIADTLVQVARSAGPRRPRGLIGLTAFRVDGPPEVTPLGEAWRDLVGGPMPDDPDARAELEARIVAADPRIERLVTSWRAGDD